jgi:hypothetical protein
MKTALLHRAQKHDIASQGDSVENASSNLREALPLSFETASPSRPAPTKLSRHEYGQVDPFGLVRVLIEDLHDAPDEFPELIGCDPGDQDAAGM